LLVQQVEDERDHGDDHAHGGRHGIVGVPEPAHQQSHARASHDAVDRRDHARPREQHLHGRRPEPHGGHRRLVERTGAGVVENSSASGTSRR
jgi:hypothetical protein